MCDKCTQIDNKIAHYMRLAMQITDKITLHGLAGLIEKMRVEKAAIQCEPGQK